MYHFQISFSEEHKNLPSGSYQVRLYDDEGYSALKKVCRIMLIYINKWLQKVISTIEGTLETLKLHLYMKTNITFNAQIQNAYTEFKKKLHQQYTVKYGWNGYFISIHLIAQMLKKLNCYLTFLVGIFYYFI